MVLSIFQLLRSLNPSMQVMTELILPQNMGYLMPVAPLRSVPQRRQPLLSPAYISGAVFVPQLIDDLMLSSYCNDAADRIIMQLLHRWHMSSSSGEGLQVHLAQLQQQLVQRQGSGGVGVVPNSSSSSGVGRGAGRMQQEMQQQKSVVGAAAAAAAAAGVAAGPPDTDLEMGLLLDQSSSGVAADTRQQQQQSAVKFAPSLGGGQMSCGAAAGAAQAAGVPTILQVRDSLTTWNRGCHNL
jgi:hypothetical protein